MPEIGGKDYLTPDELARRWSGRISIGTLSNWRSQNKGPKHVIFVNKVLYPIDEVERYEKDQLTISEE